MDWELPGSHRYVHRMAATPLVPVQLAAGEPAIWCKLEFLNPSGSTKDRIARYILEKAWRQGRLQTGDRVIEASSGSTSIAMALASAQIGVRFLAVMPEGVSNERVLLIRAYGGDVRFTPKADGIRGAIAEVERLGREPGTFLPRQFSNRDNADAHRLTTAREVIDQIPGGRVDAVVSGVGTGGTLVGLYHGFAEVGCRLIAVHAKPVNLYGDADAECCSYSARIPGVADRISEIFREDNLPGLLTLEVNDEVAIATTRQLMRLGFPVGPSSGLNFAAAREAHRRLGRPQAQVVTVFPDRMERYFTTELFQPYLA
ncbi:PLP-dependent cysteine synthase family protein [Limnoglobus roseus]|uniref:Cysteine synthase family protein n=1 Tax=Limnoglobus roseus TaxID=2598579 RepID=A0A5C1AER9_9BACT|nr:cysteine synthase family protein [Limnoglobus roseus]QEL16192.1 cysteine synthase family protein [Limnoglobus roseus]